MSREQMLQEIRSNLNATIANLRHAIDHAHELPTTELTNALCDAARNIHAASNQLAECAELTRLHQASDQFNGIGTEVRRNFELVDCSSDAPKTE